MPYRSQTIQYKSVFRPELPQPSVFVPPDGWQGSNVRPQQYQQPTGQLNYQKPSVFWTPIIDQDRGITAAAFQGSNVRWGGFQKGDPRWANYQKPSLFWTPINDQDRGITAAAWQGSNVGAPRLFNPYWLNYRDPFVFEQPEPVALPFPISGTILFFTSGDVGLTFAVTCNYQPADSPLVETWAGDPPLLSSVTPDAGVPPLWVADLPYCKPGQT